MTELGPLPEEWEVVRLGEVFSIVPKKQRERIVEDDATYRLITVKLYAKGVVLRETKAGKKIGTKKLYEVKEGDFVFSKIDARNGAWGFVGKELSGALVSGDFPILLLNREIADENFITFSLSRSSTWTMLRNIAVGTTNRRRIQPKELLKVLSIPLPPLPEQKAIAYVLRAVQEAKEKTENVIKALKELKKSLMNHLFTYGPVPLNEIGRVKLKETEVGNIPEHWEVVRLGEVVDYMKAGGTPKRSVNSFWNGDIPFALIEDITRSGIFLNTTKEHISEFGLQNSSAWLVPAGSVLLTMYGTIGKTAINTIPVATNQAILAIIPNKNRIDTLFLAYLLGYESPRLEKENIQSTQKNINKRIVQKFPIPLPPLPEQKHIAEILKAVDDKLEAERRRVEALETLFKTLLHDLLTARRRLPEEFVKRFQSTRRPERP